MNFFPEPHGHGSFRPTSLVVIVGYVAVAATPGTMFTRDLAVIKSDLTRTLRSSSERPV